MMINWKPNAWVGVDYDGTLAQNVKDGTLGPPVEAMLERVRRWLAAGIEVRLVTARANDVCEIDALDKWLRQHLGQSIPITSQKDYLMFELWDDRAVAVERDTGRQLSPSRLEP